MLFRSLRGSYKSVILDYIKDEYPELVPMYDSIYRDNDRSYWVDLDHEIRGYAERNGLRYVRDDDGMNESFDAPPIIVNYFYHEEVKKSAKKIVG